MAYVKQMFSCQCKSLNLWIVYIVKGSKYIVVVLSLSTHAKAYNRFVQPGGTRISCDLSINSCGTTEVSQVAQYCTDVVWLLPCSWFYSGNSYHDLWYVFVAVVRFDQTGNFMYIQCLNMWFQLFAAIYILACLCGSPKGLLCICWFVYPIGYLLVHLQGCSWCVLPSYETYYSYCRIACPLATCHSFTYDTRTVPVSCCRLALLRL